MPVFPFTNSLLETFIWGSSEIVYDTLLILGHCLVQYGFIQVMVLSKELKNPGWYKKKLSYLKTKSDLIGAKHSNQKLGVADHCIREPLTRSIIFTNWLHIAQLCILCMSDLWGYWNPKMKRTMKRTHFLIFELLESLNELHKAGLI